MASVAARAINVLTVLVTVPVTYNYLGAELFGVWATISSFLGILGWADLGIGNGLINCIARAYGLNDSDLAERYFSTAVFLLSGIALALLGAFAVAEPWVSWRKVFNVGQVALEPELSRAMWAFVLCFCVGLPFQLVAKARLGYQEGFLNGLSQIIGNVASLVMVLGFVWLRAPVAALVVALMSRGLIGNLVNGTFLLRKRRFLRPSLGSLDRKALVFLLSTGFLFFILQLAGAVVYMSDNLVVAQLFGAGQVAVYAITWRLFSVVGMLTSMITAPLWPSYGEAWVRGDHAWIRRTVGLSTLVVTAVSLSGAGLIVLVGEPVLRIWVGEGIEVGSDLLVAMAAVSTFQATASALSMFLNGIGKLKIQAGLAILLSVSALSLKVVLGKSYGLAGVAAGTGIGLLFVTIIPLGLYTAWELRNPAER